MLVTDNTFCCIMLVIGNTFYLTSVFDAATVDAGVVKTKSSEHTSIHSIAIGQP